MSDIKRKTVSFGDGEQDLYDFCIENSEKKGKKFTAFVKEVLREKMDQNESLETIIDKRIEEYLKTRNIAVNKTVKKEETISKFDDEDMTALSRFINKKRDN
ncbi:hypothetical protein ACJDU8_22355 [Clostridium sp. WILCCON 0269]|uniref:CopG family transcriptional regulator n=1 Tax=Candidatus Clostridium eludens TaxID=3381663 RepID=A0ABW8SQG4_9CLOT